MPVCDNNSYQSSLKEILRFSFPLSDDVIFLAFIVFVEAEPNAAKVELLDEALANVLPSRTSTARSCGGECGPVAIIEEHLEPCLLRKGTADDVTDENARLCE